MSELPSGVSRRGFLQTSAAATAAAAVSSPARAKPASANGKLRLGFIGVGDPRGARCTKHLKSAGTLQNEDQTVEIAAVCDVFNRYLDDSGKFVEKMVGAAPTKTGDYRDIINDPSIDAVVISTPDHWHAKQTIDALKAGKHVYCEKPMTHTVEEALDVHKAWKESGLVMQVGVQSTSLPVWGKINEGINAGKLGKVLMYQSEFFRNSDEGQWRYYDLARDMTPTNIDWNMFLGTEFGLAPSMPFDRAKFAQWRCYWDFGSGMFTDLFVHRTTSMLLATGLRFPARVVGAGGIYLEYDGRDVPDVASVIADFDEGVQGMITATMSSGNTPIKQTIRGHHGAAVLGTGESFTGYDFVAERPQVTRDSKIKDERVEVGGVKDSSFNHFKNFVDSALAGAPDAVNCSPELGAAAMVIVKLGAKSYREGKVFRFDKDKMAYSDANGTWAPRWEERSQSRGDASHVPGWAAGDTGSKLIPEEWQKLEGPWVDGVDPAAG
ncbi:MAG: Gfo/Idh/MocA family oxidoreductase [Planctomycetota bacterium]